MHFFSDMNKLSVFNTPVEVQKWVLGQILAQKLQQDIEGPNLELIIDIVPLVRATIGLIQVRVWALTNTSAGMVTTGQKVEYTILKETILEGSLIVEF